LQSSQNLFHGRIAAVATGTGGTGGKEKSVRRHGMIDG
jgi:hypothetical protein